MVTGLMLPIAAVFVAGVLVVGLSAPDSRLRSVTTARIRAWAWLDKSRTDSR